jgi:tetratricopeptide (TPR) repeat protein
LPMALLVFLGFFLASCGQVTSFFTDSYPQDLRELDQAGEEGTLSPEKVLALTTKLAASPDSLSAEALSKLYKYRQAAYLQLKKFDSAALAGEQYRFFAGQTGDSLGVAESLLGLHADDLDIKYLKAAKPYYPGAIELYKNAGKPRERGILHLNYGIVLTQEGEYLPAQQQLQQAYSLFAQSGSVKEKSRSSLHVGNLYRLIGDPQKARQSYQEALTLATSQNDSLGLASIYTSLGILYRRAKPDSSLYFYTRSLEYLPTGMTSKIRSRARYNLANIYYDKADYQTCFLLFNLMLEECQREGSPECVAVAYSAIGSVYGATEQRKKSIQYYLRALAMADSLGLPGISIQVLTQLGIVYKESGKLKEALETQEKVASLKDSLLSAEKVVAVHELENKQRQTDQTSSILSLQSQLNHRTVALMLLSLLVIAGLVFYRWQKRNAPSPDQASKSAGKAAKSKPARTGPQPEVRSATSPEDEGQPDYKSEGLYEQLLELYATEKPYLNPQLRIEEVAERVGVTRVKIAILLKENYNTSFITLTNHFRVEEAKRQLTDPARSHFKIDVIAVNSGFGSRQNFYKVFEAVTGVSPGGYRLSQMGQKPEANEPTDQA